MVHFLQGFPFYNINLCLFSGVWSPLHTETLTFTEVSLDSISSGYYWWSHWLGDHFESVTAYTNVWKNACVCSSRVKLLCHAFRRFVTLWQITACLTKGSCPRCFASLCFISSVYVAIKITLSLSINGSWPCACTEIHYMTSEGNTCKKSTKTSIMLRFQRTLLYQHNAGCMLNKYSISYLTTQ